MTGREVGLEWWAVLRSESEPSAAVYKAARKSEM